jgi:hypothetical protein
MSLLKPMSAAEIKEIDVERLKETIDDILSRSTENADGSIDVNGDVELSNYNLTDLPFKFNKVSGWFSCANNQLTSLEGAPKEVSGSFYCYNNKVKFTEAQVKAVCNVKGFIHTT